MKEFFGEDVLLGGSAAKEIYAAVKELPIIDYHCHLDEKKIAENAKFSDIGEMWLSGDHYKWRAMRLCGVDEYYITGAASYRDKFIKYAEILPALIGNPLYYWTHLELRQIFGITEPLCAESAERIYAQANEKLKDISVESLMKKYKVEFVATTDDPVSDLKHHAVYGNTVVSPTFRPDKLYSFDESYINALAFAVNVKINSLADLLAALKKRLDYFVAHGCKISDHGFEKFPRHYADEKEAAFLFARRDSLTSEERDGLFGFILVWLAKEYRKRGMIMQIHFAVIRNNNRDMFKTCGADSGFDLIGETPRVKAVVEFFNRVKDGERPQTVLYTLNDSNLSALAAVTGAFRNVRMGAAWWFNDTVSGIRRNLDILAEYSCLGANLGMLTDSRSFSSYARFDFFRRILSDYIGGKVEAGEYDANAAKKLAEDICYNNVKGALGL